MHFRRNAIRSNQSIFFDSRIFFSAFFFRNTIKHENITQMQIFQQNISNDNTIRFLLITTNILSSLLPQISKLIRFFFLFLRVYLFAHFFRSAIRQSTQSSRQFLKFLWNFDKFTVFSVSISFWKKIVFFFISISNVEKSFFWILNYSIFLICQTLISANRSKIWI